MGKQVSRILLPLIGAVVAVLGIATLITLAYTHSRNLIIALYILLIVAVPVDWTSFAIHVRAYGKTRAPALGNRIVWTFLIAFGTSCIGLIVVNILTGDWLPKIVPQLLLVAGVLFPSAASVVFLIHYLARPK